MNIICFGQKQLRFIKSASLNDIGYYKNPLFEGIKEMNTMIEFEMCFENS